MSDATTTLRALAAACDACHDLARTATYRTCLDDQRRALAGALPGTRWDGHAAALRTMADTVEALEAERDTLRADLDKANDRLAEAEDLIRGALEEFAWENDDGKRDLEVAAARKWLGVSDG